jgi:hypothetical protein
MKTSTIAIVALIIATALWGLSNVTSKTSVQGDLEPVEVMEVTQVSEEELRRLEWEKEAEEVKAQHLKKKELEHERSVLLNEIKERETRIKELEKELGF